SATERVSEVLIAETGTLGLRGAILDRWPQTRREIVVDIDGHDIRVKISNGRAKVEHDDAQRAALASGRPLREVLAQAERLALD
ncbi:MAG: nickel insertion protein, partial [Actinomycetota bacterium]